MKTKLILLIVLGIISCNDKKSTNNIEFPKTSKTSKIELESKEVYESALVINTSILNFDVDLDSIDSEYQELIKQDPAQALNFAKELKEYGFDLQFKQIDKDVKLDNQRRAQWNNSTAGKIKREHPFLE